MTTNIICRLQVEGLHWWSEASKYEPTMVYLESPHRHMFHIEVKKQVFHDDRDVEFIVFKRKVINYLETKYYVCFFLSKITLIKYLLKPNYKHNFFYK